MTDSGSSAGVTRQRRWGTAMPARQFAFTWTLTTEGVDEIAIPGGTQKVVIINESGLYSLILSSKLELDKAFKRWGKTNR